MADISDTLNKLAKDALQKNLDDFLKQNEENASQSLKMAYKKGFDDCYGQLDRMVSKALKTHFKAELDEVKNQVSCLRSEGQEWQKELDGLDRNSAIVSCVFGIGVLILLATTLILAHSIFPMIAQGTGIRFIWHAVSPNLSFWGVLRGAAGIIGIFLLLLLELIIVAFPTTISIKILMKFSK